MHSVENPDSKITLFEQNKKKKKCEIFYYLKIVCKIHCEINTNI